MHKALCVLGGGEARRGHICYLIEGDASRRTVHGGNVGRRSWDQVSYLFRCTSIELKRTQVNVIVGQYFRSCIDLPFLKYYCEECQGC